MGGEFVNVCSDDCGADVGKVISSSAMRVCK